EIAPRSLRGFWLGQDTRGGPRSAYIRIQPLDHSHDAAGLLQHCGFKALFAELGLGIMAVFCHHDASHKGLLLIAFGTNRVILVSGHSPGLLAPYATRRSVAWARG